MPNNTRSAKGGTHRNPGDDDPLPPIDPNDFRRAELYIWIYPKLGGAENVIIRESSPEVIDERLRATEDDLNAKIEELKKTEDYPEFWSAEYALAEVKKFLELDLFTSTKALRKHFPQNLDFLVQELRLKEGRGLETAKRDMPPSCQRVILYIVVSIIEETSFGFITIYLKIELSKADLISAGDFEISAEHRAEFFETEYCLRVLQRRNPGFNRKEFRNLMARATYVRNKAVHRKWRTTDFIYDAVLLAIKVLETLGEVQSQRAKYLFKFLENILEDLDEWRAWSWKNKKDTLDELSEAFAEVEVREEENRSLPAALRLPTDLFRVEKRSMANIMLNKRQVDRFQKGRKLGNRLRKEFEGSEEQDFRFSSWFKDLRQEERELGALAVVDSRKHSYVNNNSNNDVERAPKRQRTDSPDPESTTRLYYEYIEEQANLWAEALALPKVDDSDPESIRLNEEFLDKHPKFTAGILEGKLFDSKVDVDILDALCRMK